MYVGFPERGRPTKLLRQKIKLEANDSPTLFAIRPIWDAKAGPRLLPPYLNPIDGTLLRQDPRGGSYDYEVFSDAVSGAIQPGEDAQASRIGSCCSPSKPKPSKRGSARSPSPWSPPSRRRNRT